MDLTVVVVCGFQVAPVYNAWDWLQLSKQQYAACASAKVATTLCLYAKHAASFIKDPHVLHM